MGCKESNQTNKVSLTSEMLQYLFAVEKYQFCPHLIYIEFTANDNINTDIWPLDKSVSHRAS